MKDKPKRAEAIHRVDAYLTDEELEAFDLYLEPWGGKRGPFIRQLIFRELQKAKEGKA